MTGHDHSYKNLFSHPKMVEDLLTGFVKFDWVNELDFCTLEKLNNTYITDDLRERTDDVVWRVKFRDQWLYVYLLQGFQPELRYLLIDEGVYSATELEQLNNVTAALIRAEIAASREEVIRVLANLIVWLPMEKQSDLRRAFKEWFNRILLPKRMPGTEVEEVRDLTEIQTMLAERVKDWTRNWREEGFQAGIEQGIEKGIEKGREEGIEEGIGQVKQRCWQSNLPDALAPSLNGQKSNCNQPAVISLKPGRRAFLMQKVWNSFSTEQPSESFSYCIFNCFWSKACCDIARKSIPPHSCPFFFLRISLLTLV